MFAFRIQEHCKLCKLYFWYIVLIVVSRLLTMDVV